MLEGCLVHAAECSQDARHRTTEPACFLPYHRNVIHHALLDDGMGSHEALGAEVLVQGKHACARQLAAGFIGGSQRQP